MNFPVVIHKDEGSDYGVTVPDLPGCFSAGSTLDEALAMAREAIELHLEGLIEDGEPVPMPGGIEQHQANPDYAGGIWAIVSISPSRLRVEAQRVNITMPRRILDAVDSFAKAHHETRSGLLAKAVTAYIRNGRASSSPKERRAKGTRRKKPESRSRTR